MTHKNPEIRGKAPVVVKASGGKVFGSATAKKYDPVGPDLNGTLRLPALPPALSCRQPQPCDLPYTARSSNPTMRSANPVAWRSDAPDFAIPTSMRSLSKSPRGNISGFFVVCFCCVFF